MTCFSHFETAPFVDLGLFNLNRYSRRRFFLGRLISLKHPFVFIAQVIGENRREDDRADGLGQNVIAGKGNGSVIFD